jgi:ATP-dependent DNA ligase
VRPRVHDAPAVGTAAQWVDNFSTPVTYNSGSTWAEPAVLAEIEYSALTAEKLLRAPIFKGIRDD